MPILIWSFVTPLSSVRTEAPADATPVASSPSTTAVASTLRIFPPRPTWRSAARRYPHRKGPFRPMQGTPCTGPANDLPSGRKKEGFVGYRWGIAATGGIAAGFAEAMQLVEGGEVV